MNNETSSKWTQPFWALPLNKAATQVVIQALGHGDTVRLQPPDYPKKKDVYEVDKDLAESLLREQSLNEWKGKIYTQRTADAGVSRYKDPKGAIERKDRRAKDKLANTSMPGTRGKV